MSLISIVTPTFRRHPTIVQRCIDSVQRQTHPTFEHIICSDGAHEPEIEQRVRALNDPRIRYRVSDKKHGDYGSGVRQEVMTTQAAGQYFVFLDDDNILFPTYLEKMLGALQRSSADTRLAVCQVLHFGPLQAFWGPPPVVLPAARPRLYHTDTLQLMVEREAMLAVGWKDRSYVADGITYQELGDRFPWVAVHECLCAHL